MQPLKECQLQDVMRRRREACAEFESKPAATTADASGDAKPRGQATAPRQSLTTDSLQELLSERRKRCEVLESSPLPQLADVLWNQEVSKSERRSECERPAQESRADFKWDHPVRVSDRKEAANEKEDGREMPECKAEPSQIFENLCIYRPYIYKQ